MRTSPLVALTLASLAAAQTTHVVGPGGYATINAALAAALPGDIVSVQPGSYPAFTATLGVTIRAATAGSVFVGLGSAVQAGPVHLIGLDLSFLSVSGATCTLDQCLIRPLTGVGGPCLSASNARVHLNECTVGQPGANPQLSFGSNAGLFATGSTISAVDTTFRGRDFGTVVSSPAGAGIQLMSSTFHGSRLDVRGGTNAAATGSSAAGPALDANPTSTVWICDSTLAGGVATSLGTGPGACSVQASLGRLARCTLLPATCAPPVIPLSGPAIGVHRVAPPQAGGSLQLAFDAAPNDWIGVFASFALGGATFAELEQPVALDLGLLVALDVLVADGTGHATGAWNLPPGTSNLALWLQAVTPGALPLQLSPVTGGVVR